MLIEKQASLGPQSNWAGTLPIFLVPLAFIAVYHSGAELQDTFGKSTASLWQALSVTISVLGALLRMATVGFVHDGRAPAQGGGIYRFVSQPLAVSNFLILTGFALATQVWWFVLIATAVFAFSYIRQLNRERPASAAAGEPAFFINAALRWGFPSLYLVVAFTVAMEVAHDLRVGDATMSHWPADWTYYFATFAVASVLFVVVRFLDLPDSKTSATNDAVPETRGLLVTGRAGIVDTLENLISGGQQEDILEATLIAAELDSGSRIVDIGCGTGKLAVAASRLVGPNGAVLGVDATPDMIDLARERATTSGSNARFKVGVGEDIQLADGSVDAVTSSYFFHHLPSEVKVQALREMWRVLAPGGRLIITDYGKPRTLGGYLASIPMRFDFYEYVRPQLRGELEDIIAAADIGTIEVVSTFLGYIHVLRVRKQ